MELPDEVPTPTVPADTRNRPPLSVQEKAPGLIVPPLFHNPEDEVRDVDEVNGVIVDALDNLNVPDVMTKGFVDPFNVINDFTSRIFA